MKQTFKYKAVKMFYTFLVHLLFYFNLSAQQVVTNWGRAEIYLPDSVNQRFVLLENDSIRVKYAFYSDGNGSSETSIREYILKPNNVNVAGFDNGYIDACANRSHLTDANIENTTDTSITAKLIWNNYSTNVTIFKNKRYIKLDYLEYGVNIVDIASPGGTNSTENNIYKIYGEENWKRKHVIYPEIYYDRFPGDAGYQNIVEPDSPDILIF